VILEFRKVTDPGQKRKLWYRKRQKASGKLFTDMCLCHRAVYFSPSCAAAMSCDWEGNRMSGVALAMRRRLKWFVHRRAQGLSISAPHQHSSLGVILFNFTLQYWIKGVLQTLNSTLRPKAIRGYVAEMEPGHGSRGQRFWLGRFGSGRVTGQKS